MNDRLSRERIAELRSSRKPLTWAELLALLDAYEELREVARSGVELDDPRIGYVTVQIDRETWQAVRERDDG